MAINIQTLKTRSLTALVFVVVMLAGLFINAWTFALLFTIVMLGCIYEYIKIIKLISPAGYVKFIPLSIVYIILPVLMLLDLGITIIGPNTNDNTGLRFLYSPLMPCAIIFSIWINDTMAYIVGSMIGKTPLSPISPKKTWEGTIGGIILCVVVMSLIAYFAPVAQSIALHHWIIIAAICAITGTLGDLLESKLKRLANIKDSGSFMPGHGGFLDRFDSLLPASLFVWLYVKLFT
ncbi:MAG: phosphatidate cytidylyltransferase [Pedobacter sp.]|nr:MAG: phosphatidate cytidylyltransferase [Pedobacter sp.]